uniref:Uncharacterized protein n=1 Tax=Babesia bovis TaxID=5865 RepID=A7AVC9_BABBO|eukprot:XP_001609323.1 hypothetical protein [Babesia bovis T2Bo]
MLSLVTNSVTYARAHNTRKWFSSIFDVIRERRRTVSVIEKDVLPSSDPPCDAVPVPQTICNSDLQQLWKQFSILGTKPSGYRDNGHLRYIPNYRHLDQFLLELDKEGNKSSAGDYVRVLQFLVGSNLCNSDVYSDIYRRCLSHCLDNIGFMTHQHLASFSQTQLIIDPTDSNAFNRICLNFERGLTGEEVEQFRMLSNAILRSKSEDLSCYYLNILHRYLDNPERWDSGLLTTALGVLEKYYYRDTVALSKLGNIVSMHLTKLNTHQLVAIVNNFAKFSYKHKELIHAIVRSPYASDGHILSRLRVLHCVANLLAKVDYKPMDVITKIVNGTVDSCESLLQCSGHPPWIVVQRHATSVPGLDAVDPKTPVVITGTMIWDMLTPGDTSADTAEKTTKRPTVLRRLISRPRKDPLDADCMTASVDRLRVTPQSVDILRFRSLKECMDEFIMLHFDGRHPAHNRLHMRKLMKCQQRDFNREPYNSSKILRSIKVEKPTESRINLSYRKVKKIMKYSGSRHIQPSRYYINECRALKRAFLRPYKELANGLHGSVLPRTKLETVDAKKQLELIDIWNNCTQRSTSSPNMGSTGNCIVKPTDVACLSGSTSINDMSIIPEAQSVMQHLETYVDSTSPHYVDNKLLLRPVRLGSIFSWRLKRRLRLLELSHDRNLLSNTMTYMLDNGFWRRPTVTEACISIKEQPMGIHLIGILTSLYKLNFISADLIKRSITVLGLFKRAELEDFPVEYGNSSMSRLTAPLVTTFLNLGRLVKAVRNVIFHNSFRDTAQELINIISNSGILEALSTGDIYKKRVLGIHEITDFLHRFNTLVFHGYINIHVPRLQDSRGQVMSIPDQDTIDSITTRGWEHLRQSSGPVIQAYIYLTMLVTQYLPSLEGSINESQQFIVTKLIDELVFIRWIVWNLGPAYTDSKLLTGLAHLDREMYPLVLKYTECVDQRSQAIYGLCALYRHDNLEALMDANNVDNNVTSRIKFSNINIAQLMARHRITMDDINRWISAVAYVKSPMDTRFALFNDSLRSGMVVLHTPEDARASASGTLYNFYLRYYSSG